MLHESSSRRFTLLGPLVALLMAVGHSFGADSQDRLEDFPKVKRLWLATSRVEILPVGHHDVVARRSGELQLLKKDGQRLERGEVWAVETPKKLAIEREAIRLEEEILGEKLKNLKLDHEERIDALRDAYDEMREQEAQLKLILERPDVQESEVLLEKAETAEERLSLKMARGHDRLTNVMSGTLYEAERKKLELDMRRRHEEFKNLQRGTEMRSPIDGVLHLNEAVWAEDEEREGEKATFQWVENGKALAKIKNEQFYEVFLINGGELVGGAKRESLSLVINPQRNERRVDALYVRSERSGGRDQRESLVFRVEDASVENAKKSKGRQSTALVYVDFEKAMRFVPKAWLLEKFNEEGPLKTWEVMIREMNPRAKMVAEGHDAVAVDMGEQDESVAEDDGETKAGEEEGPDGGGLLEEGR